MGIIAGFVIGYAVGSRAGSTDHATRESIRAIAASDELRSFAAGGLTLLARAVQFGADQLSQRIAGVGESPPLHRVA